jgi:RNA polymerase sigma-70 factor (ECF subfamily)
LRSFVRRRLGRGLRARESSQDLVQSICREVLEDLPELEFRGEGGFRHWLFRRAENKIRDRGRYWGRERRTSEREVRLPAGGGGELARQLVSLRTPSRDASSKEEIDRLERAFAALPADHREVVFLARIAGMPHAEIAGRMGRSQAATRTLLCRALARLATLLEG